jgi:hypothetical protein
LQKVDEKLTEDSLTYSASKYGGLLMTMRFYMPSSYSLETLLAAVDKRIKFSKVPAASYAVIKFSGFAGEDNIARHERKLGDFLEYNGTSADGQAITAFYNPPWTLPFLRRNEVWLPIHTAL